jgi:hypothetical protein
METPSNIARRLIGEATLKVGARVKLRGQDPSDDFPDGLPEEVGSVASVHAPSQTAVVVVDPQYRGEDEDDGMREVGLDQLEVLPDAAPPKGFVQAVAHMRGIQQRAWKGLN